MTGDNQIPHNKTYEDLRRENDELIKEQLTKFPNYYSLLANIGEYSFGVELATLSLQTSDSVELFNRKLNYLRDAGLIKVFANDGSTKVVITAYGAQMLDIIRENALNNLKI